VSRPLHPDLIGRDEVVKAAERIRGRVRRTPLMHCEGLSRLTGAEVWLKLETLQATGAFKERGAANRIAVMSEEERRGGVVAVSSGNHAQAVARHAALSGVSAVLVMPRCTPAMKVKRTAAWGARVVLAGDTLVEARAVAQEIGAAEGRLFMHPYDDRAVVAGQGTLALEMLEDLPDLDVLMAPVGGGGLFAGCLAALGEGGRPVEAVGVEVEAYAPFVQVLAGREVQVGGPTLADGIAVAEPGEIALEMIRARGCEVVSVSEAQVAQAMALLVREAKVVAEGAGAVGLAALLGEPGRFAGRRVAVVVSGGNLDSSTLARVMVETEAA
jgi:threonine dehydratase